METDETSKGTAPFAPAIDPHTHLFPERLARAIRASLAEEAGWSFPTPLAQSAIESVLEHAGVVRYVSLPYAHDTGVASALNDWTLDRAADSEFLIPFATAHPEDDDVGAIVESAFDRGAQGLKFHCPVQECAPADPRIEPALEAAVERDRPVTYHGGTAPMFEESPYVGADRFEELLASYPDLRVCCAHMGTYQEDRFLEFTREYDRVYLDTTFAMSSKASDHMAFDPATIPDETLVELSESIMYGSDYPTIPYAYVHERKHLLGRDLPDKTFRDLFYQTAATYLEIDPLAEDSERDK